MRSQAGFCPATASPTIFAVSRAQSFPRVSVMITLTPYSSLKASSNFWRHWSFAVLVQYSRNCPSRLAPSMISCGTFGLAAAGAGFSAGWAAGAAAVGFAAGRVGATGAAGAVVGAGWGAGPHAATARGRLANHVGSCRTSLSPPLYRPKSTVGADPRVRPSAPSRRQPARLGPSVDERAHTRVRPYGGPGGRCALRTSY